MTITSYKGVRYETLRCSVPDGFAMELWRLRRLRKSQLVVEVFCPEDGDEPDFEVHLGSCKAPSDVIETFIADAKKTLQQWRTVWVQSEKIRQWPEGTLELATLYHAGCDTDSRQYVQWAVNALEAEFDTPSIRTLAGLDLCGEPVRAETVPAFESSLLELEIELPDPDTTARLYMLEVAAAIVMRSIAPQVGAELIHSRVVSPLEHPPDLQPWCFVWEGNSADCSSVLEGEALDAEIFKVANDFSGVPKISKSSSLRP